MSSEEVADFDDSDVAAPHATKFIFPPGFDVDSAWDANLSLLRQGWANSDFVKVTNTLEFFEPVLSHRLFSANISRTSRALPVLVDSILDPGIILH
jgi:hypothetical protein